MVCSAAVLEAAWNLIVLCAAIGLYFLPFVLAKYRKHRQSDAILLTNLLLGWTGVGWIAALIWSATATEGKKA